MRFFSFKLPKKISQKNKNNFVDDQCLMSTRYFERIILRVYISPGIPLRKFRGCNLITAIV